MIYEEHVLGSLVIMEYATVVASPRLECPSPACIADVSPQSPTAGLTHANPTDLVHVGVTIVTVPCT